MILEDLLNTHSKRLQIKKREMKQKEKSANTRRSLKNEMSKEAKKAQEDLSEYEYEDES
jgi:hypothetical protein